MTGPDGCGRPSGPLLVAESRRECYSRFHPPFRRPCAIHGRKETLTTFLRCQQPEQGIETRAPQVHVLVRAALGTSSFATAYACRASHPIACLACGPYASSDWGFVNSRRQARAYGPLVVCYPDSHSRRDAHRASMETSCGVTDYPASAPVSRGFCAHRTGLLFDVASRERSSGIGRSLPAAIPL